MSYLHNLIDTQETPQTERLAHRREQARNSAGGYVWAVDDWTRLERFLILGSEGGTYYVQERALTIENAAAVMQCLKTDGLRVVRTVVDISSDARAPKSDPALFALALAASPTFADPKTISAALAALPVVARTGSHLCSFAAFVENLRGWGRSLRTAVADWYLNSRHPSWRIRCSSISTAPVGRIAICCVCRIRRRRRPRTTLCSSGPWMASWGIWLRPSFSPEIFANCAPRKRPASLPVRTR